MELVLDPSPGQWRAMLMPPDGRLLGVSRQAWRDRTRQELSLETSRPIIATGHQTMLWHPGILAKYLATVAYARKHELAMVNLIVDQHADDFGSFDAPMTGFEGSLATRQFVLTTPRKSVPMGLHEPFTPPRALEGLRSPLESVNQGVRDIHEAVYRHRRSDNAAMQMAGALQDLMQRWVPAMPAVTSSALMTTSLTRAILERMIANPARCAVLYNDAVRSHPDAGVGELLVRDDYVEMPLWRIRPDGRRMRAYDNDIERWLAERDDALLAESDRMQLMPRALLLTALVRLGMCDLFIHGTGGATYDQAMEQWVQTWLGTTPSSIAVVSATIRLPLLEDDIDERAAERIIADARHKWHDPDRAGEQSSGAPSDQKQAWLRQIESLPRRSAVRRRAFIGMHQEIEARRAVLGGTIADLQARARRASHLRHERTIAARRDWPFPLYSTRMIDDLRESIDCAIGCADVCWQNGGNST